MDLQDFEGQDMYFNDEVPQKVTELIEKASQLYGKGEAEKPLLRAFFLAPYNLVVHVALYRFYYYQHRYSDALFIADKAMGVTGEKLGLPGSWRDIEISDLGSASMKSMGMLRFYLLALKGAGYLNLRMGNVEDAVEILEKIVMLDQKNRLGASMLLDVAKARMIDEIAEKSDNVVCLNRH